MERSSASVPAAVIRVKERLHRRGGDEEDCEDDRAGVIVYFIGAVVTHLRAGDRAIASPLLPGALAVAALALRIASA